MTWHMPAEWGPHRRTWMAWPCNDFVFGEVGSAEAAYRAWAGAANAVRRFEPVVMVCNPGEAATARGYLDERIEIVEHPLGDSWMRDTGPTFVIGEDGSLGGVDWTFNGWGGRTFPEAADDALVARFVCERTGAMRIPSLLVNEGGGIHTDGQGTLLLTESVQLNPNRNPNWSREAIETELHAKLGTRKAIWLKRGLMGDTLDGGTDGHVDTLAAFVKPGVVVVHGQPDPDHPDHKAAQENAAILRDATDAQGNTLEVVVLDAPDAPPDLPCSYVNFSFVNGGVVLCGFDDPQDSAIVETFRRFFNDREIVQVPARDIFRGGGGVHCITQHEPLVEL